MPGALMYNPWRVVPFAGAPGFRPVTADEVRTIVHEELKNFFNVGGKCWALLVL